MSTANVVNITPDEIDPSYAQVHYDDGSFETMHAAEAEALAPMGPPLPPEGPPLPPTGGPEMVPANPVQLPTEADLVTAARGGVEPQFIDAGVTIAPAGDDPALAMPPARIDPGSEMVAPPGAAGDGMAPYSESAGQTVTETERAEDADTRQGRVDSSYDALIQGEAAAEDAKRNSAYASAQDQIEAGQTKEAQLREQQRQLELAQEEHEKVIKGIEENPIDPDDFWNDSPARKAGAWIALALSGFLQGVTKGANPALAQMMQAMQHAEDSYVRRMQQQNDTVLKRRERAMESGSKALASIKLEMGKVFETRMKLEAQRAGIDALPPALTTVAAKWAVKRAEAKNQIGAETDRTVARRLDEERRFNERAQRPVYQADRDLAALGIDRKRYDELINGETKFGTMVKGVDRLKKIRDRIAELGQANGGKSLPHQDTLSADTFGAAPLVARLGGEDAAKQVESRQLTIEAEAALKQALGSTKYFDSEKEVADLKRLLDTGTLEGALRGIDSALEKANQATISTADGASPGNAQGLIDYVRRVQTSNRGVENAPGEFKPRIITGGAPKATEEDLVQATKEPAPAPTSGGSAPRPLAESPQELRRAIQSAEGLSYNPDALARIIRFESGGNPKARNKQSGATGAIQWMPDVYAGMEKPPGYENVRFEDLPDLTLEEQLPLVEAYFQQRGLPPDADAGEMYLAVAAPAFLGKEDDAVVYRRGSKAWEQNPAWRPAGGGDITVGDIRAKGRSL